jgi:hypothetical protein
LAKNWIEQSNTRSKQTNLCEEADRLIKFHATLAQAAVPSPNIQTAQVAVVGQLDRVLDKLSQTLTAPLGSAGYMRSAPVIRLEEWLLLYRPTGFWSGLLHLLFYLMIPIWFLFLDVELDVKTREPDIAMRVTVLAIVLIPILVCNYLARRVDAWTRKQTKLGQPAPPK